MSRILMQGAKISLVNQIGFMLYLLYTLLLTVGCYFFMFLAGILLGTSFTFQLSTSLFASLSIFAVILFILVILIFTFLQTIGAAFVMGGLYGTASDMLFDDQFSVPGYLYHSTRNTLRLTGWQWALFLLFLPFFVLFIVLITPDLVHFPYQEVIAPLAAFVVILLFCSFFQYTPLFIVRYRAKVWQSFGWSLRLIKRRFFSTVLGFLLLTVPNLLIQLLYLTIAAAVITGIHFLPFPSFVNVTLQAIIGILTFLFWIVFLFPFITTCSILLSIQHYRRHLEDALPEATLNATQQTPFA